jgi:hypothetical protein
VQQFGRPPGGRTTTQHTEALQVTTPSRQPTGGARHALHAAANLGCVFLLIACASPKPRPTPIPASPWDEFWRSHGVSPAPPPDAFAPPPSDIEVRNLTDGKISDETARRWVLADIRRGNADTWALLNLRKDIADAGVLGPPGLNGTAASIIAQRAKWAVRLEVVGTPSRPFFAAVIAVPPEQQQEERSGRLTSFVIVLVRQSTSARIERVLTDGTREAVGESDQEGAWNWQLDAGEFRDDPIVGPLWYQAMGWTCHTEGENVLSRLCALATPARRVAPQISAARGHARLRTLRGTHEDRNGLSRAVRHHRQHDGSATRLLKEISDGRGRNQRRRERLRESKKG